MLIRSQTTTLLQIFGELSIHSQMIFKSMREADDQSPGSLEHECVNIEHFLPVWPQSTTCLHVAQSTHHTPATLTDIFINYIVNTEQLQATNNTCMKHLPSSYIPVSCIDANGDDEIREFLCIRIMNINSYNNGNCLK